MYTVMVVTILVFLAAVSVFSWLAVGSDRHLDVPIGVMIFFCIPYTYLIFILLVAVFIGVTWLVTMLINVTNKMGLK